MAAITDKEERIPIAFLRTCGSSAMMSETKS